MFIALLQYLRLFVNLLERKSQLGLKLRCLSLRRRRAVAEKSYYSLPISRPPPLSMQLVQT